MQELVCVKTPDPPDPVFYAAIAVATAVKRVRDRGLQRGPRITIDRVMVDAFRQFMRNGWAVKAADDVVAGSAWLGLCLVPRLLGSFYISIRGYSLRERVVHCNVPCELPIGSSIEMRYRAGDFHSDRAGMRLRVNFWVHLAPEATVISDGWVDVDLVKDAK